MLHNFVDQLTHDDLLEYINDICKVNSCTNSDSVVGERIMKMTCEKYGLIKSDYMHINGLIMLAEGIIE